MRIAVVTILPDLFRDFLATSLVGRALEDESLAVEIHDLRTFATDRHQSVDDEPFGGGGGMVMRAPPWIAAVREIAKYRDPWRILMSPQGKPLDEHKVRELADRDDLILMCGRYEGVDERVCELVVDEEISIGDFVLSGGEVPAMVVIEAISRQIPGIVGRAESVEQDSFRCGLLDFPQYTRPRDVEGKSVPEVLLSGDHRAIKEWRENMALMTTLRKRPDLLEKAELSQSQRKLLAHLDGDSVAD